MNSTDEEMSGDGIIIEGKRDFKFISWLSLSTIVASKS